MERLAAVVFLAVVAGCWSSKSAPQAGPVVELVSPPDQTNNAVDDLLTLMRDRLLLMHEVAKWKWNEGKPIVDPERENQLLADLEQGGLAYGLSRDQTRDFMAAQTEAAKLIQQADFARWKDQSQGAIGTVRDLNNDLRPLITQLSDQMLAQLAKVAPVIDGQTKANINQRAAAIVHGDGIDNAVRQAAIRPLLDVAAD